MASVIPTSQSSLSRATPSPKRVTDDMVRVMLVDDSLTVRTVFSRMIQREDDLAVVAEAGTAEKALFALRSTEVDVILLDLEMPGMGGLRRMVRRNDRAVTATIIGGRVAFEEGQFADAFGQERFGRFLRADVQDREPIERTQAAMALSA